MPQKSSNRRPERRRMERADARLSMRLDAAREEGGRSHLVTESQNISASGVYCRSPHYLAPLSKVDLTIVLPKLPGGRGAKELIKCEGIVVRCEPATARRSERAFELACMFSGLDDRRRGMLDEFVTWRNLQALRSAVNGRVRTPSRAKNGRTPARPVKPASRAATGTTRVTRPASRAARTSARKRTTLH